LARDLRLPVAEKSDSQDICFVPQGRYTSVIERLKPGAAEAGDIVHVDGRVLGRHKGIINYTIGQRRGLGIPGPSPLYVVRLDAAGKLADAVKSGAWDVAFLGAEPQRANEIAFTAAYLEIPATYLVPAGSPIRSVGDVDREGIRIAVSDKSAYELWLSRNIKHAQLIRTQGIDASFDLFVGQKMDALAGLKPRLLMDVTKLPGARLLDGQFTAVQQAIGTPKSRDAAAKYLRAFVEEVKASGLVAEAISKNAVKGVSVAPPASAQK